MQLDPAKKEEILKKVKDPNSVKEAVEKAFEVLDKDKSGFIDKKELGKKHNLPEPTEEQAAEGKKILEKINGKISKEDLTKIFTAIFKKIEEHLSK